MDGDRISGVFALSYRAKAVLISTAENYSWGITAHGIGVVAELGLVGTLLLLWVVVRFFSATRAMNDADNRFFRVLSISMISVLLFGGLFHHIIENTSFYVLLGIAYANRDLMRRTHVRSSISA